jgi:UDP-glucose 6-dehydrogenase
MLMIYDPTVTILNKLDPEYYTFDDEYISETAEYECIDLGASRFPRHVGVFVRDYVEKNMTNEILKTIHTNNYEAADHMIVKALRAYTQLPLKYRIKLHMKELDKIREELRYESHIRLS